MQSQVLSEMDGVYLKLFLNPVKVLNDLTVKRFYRYVLESTPRFGIEGYALHSQRFLFADLSAGNSFTLRQSFIKCLWMLF